MQSAWDLRYQHGQVLILVVFAMVVTLTVGLSVAARSITNLRSTSDQQSSQRALAQAEAGVERVIQTTGSDITITPAASGDTFAVSSKQVLGTYIALNNGNDVLVNQPVDVWLATPPAYSDPHSGDLTVYWANSPSGNPTAAIEVAVIDASGITHYVYDYTAGRGNNFDHANTATRTIAGGTYNYNATFTVANGKIARIMPLYGDTPIAIEWHGTGGVALPSQGQQISSTGQAGGTERNVSAYRSYPQIPVEMFPYAIFCGKKSGTDCNYMHPNP